MFGFELTLAILNALTLLTELYSLHNSSDRVLNRRQQQIVLKRKCTSIRLESVTWNLHEAETEIY